MIALAQIFAQQARNTVSLVFVILYISPCIKQLFVIQPNSLAVPYCQQAPRNAELNGLFQCQFAGANQNQFVGGLAPGQPGTMPLGYSAPLSPLGSCPANPEGPIPDGQQLSDITTNPHAPGGTDTSSSDPPAAQTPTPSSAPALVASSVTPPASSISSTASGFALANGQAAQKLNAQFATLTADSSCTGI